VLDVLEPPGRPEPLHTQRLQARVRPAL
jgi:hypothetical protein